MRDQRGIAGWRRRKPENRSIPLPLFPSQERRAYAELYENRALYDPPDVPSPEEILIAREDEAAIGDALARIPAREERILRQYFGLGVEPTTFIEIAEQFELSTARIHQLRWRAFRRLRAPSRVKSLPWRRRTHEPAAPNLYVPHWRRAELRAAAKAAKALADEAAFRAAQKAAAAERRALRERGEWAPADVRGRSFDLRAPRNPAQAEQMARDETYARILEKERAALAELRLQVAAQRRREEELRAAIQAERDRAKQREIEEAEDKIRLYYVRALNSLSGSSHYDANVRVVYQKLGMTPPTPGKSYGR